jgi:hypothetical protein
MAPTLCHKYLKSLAAGFGTGSLLGILFIVPEKFHQVLVRADSNLCTCFHAPCRCTISEILVAIFLFFCATYNLVLGDDFYFVYIYLQAIAFLIVGTGFCGTSSSNS